MRRPGERGGRPRHCRAAPRIAATAKQLIDSTSVAAGTDDDADAEDSVAYRQWRAELVADTEAAMEVLAQDTLRSLSTEQVDGLRWIGLMDEGWSRMYRELARRGEE